jgi:transcriptional regulator with XRE-family HTH domain
MSKLPKIFFPENVKFLRGRKNLSQENLAQQLGITRVKLNAIESGKTINPPMEDLVKFSGFFKISIDSLLKVDISRLLELQLRELEAGNDVYMMGSKIRVLAISIDKNNKENAEYVPIQAKAGYRSGFTDPEFIASLPKFHIPTLPRQGTFRTFPVSGDSMLIPDGSEVTGEYVENWKDIKPDTPCIVILNGMDDFVFKLVTLQKNGVFLLKSLNKIYKPYTVEAGEVLELWKFKLLHIKELPEPPTEREELKAMLQELKIEITKLKK